MDWRIVRSKSLRIKVSYSFHSAYQRVVGMTARINCSGHRPGMNASIHNFRANCIVCSSMAPNQPQEPIIITPSLDWPFEQIVMNLFSVRQYAHLVCTDKLTSWVFYTI